MKKNIHGFSVIEVLIVVAFIGVLVAVGWLYFARQSTPAPAIEQEKNIDDGLKAFSDEKLEFEFRYPSDWKSEVLDMQSSDSNAVTVTALGTTKTDGMYPDIKEGAEVYMVCQSAAYDTIDQFRKENTIYKDNSTDKRKVTVNGVDAEEYVVDYEGPKRHITEFFVNKKSCSVSMSESVYKKSEYAKIYNQIVSSIKF